MGSSSSHATHSHPAHSGGVQLDAPLDREHELQVHEHEYRKFVGLIKRSTIFLVIIVALVVWLIAG